jgi:hypothetical protein
MVKWFSAGGFLFGCVLLVLLAFIVAETVTSS